MLCLPAGAHADVLRDLRLTIGRVPNAIAYRYDARDDKGAPLDALDVVQAGRRYVGVYHTTTGPTFALQVATSTDLMHWTRRATLDTDASQGAIAATKGGGYLVAYEKSFSPALPARPLLGPRPVVHLVRASQLRFRQYANLSALLAARPSADFTAPRTLGLLAEGTPDIDWVAGGPDPAQMIARVGLHYYSDVDGDGVPDVDRQATGTLRGFSAWTEADAPLLNAEFLQAHVLHPGFSAAPEGNIGDRDDFIFEHRRLAIDEAQYLRGDFGSWRLFLRDPGTARVYPLSPVTHGGSQAFGNPSITALRTPDGRRALFVSLFVFAEGAAAGEKGPLIYVARQPALGAARRRSG